MGPVVLLNPRGSLPGGGCKLKSLRNPSCSCITALPTCQEGPHCFLRSRMGDSPIQKSLLHLSRSGAKSSFALDLQEPGLGMKVAL